MAEDPRFAPDEVRLGHLMAPFGIRGELRVFLYNPDSPLLGRPRSVTLVSPAGERRTATVGVRTGAGKKLIAQVSGVDTPEVAAAFGGWELVVPRAALPRPKPGEYYQHDLLGLPVRSAGGRELGHLREIVPSGGIDIYIVDGPGGERFVPALRDRVLEVVPGSHILLAEDAGEEA